MSTGYICPFSDCHEPVPIPDDDGCSFCWRCGEMVEAEKVIEFDREDIAYEKMRNRGWED